MGSRTIPMAIRTSSTRTVMTMVGGSTRTTTTPTTGGIVRTGSRSSSRNSLHFSPVLTTGEFCFMSCPFQPPNIFPASSSLSDRAIYFLSSKDLVSHRIIRSTCRVSIFLIASLTYGCFSVRERKLAADIASMISINNVSIRWPREWRWILGKS